MLPERFRNELFDDLSTRTMRYVRAVPVEEAEGLVADVYEQVIDDFFINGSITCQSSVPPLMAAMWCGGRETILVSDRLDSSLKEAMAAAISRHNDCPYCEDMLVGLVHGDGDHQAASSLLRGEDEQIADAELRERVRWAVSTVDPEADWTGPPPFRKDELPEALGSVFAFGYINRVSHVTMADSPLQAPLGLDALKRGAVRFFGGELRDVVDRSLEPGRALALVEEAPIPEDLWWAEPNPRVADALARWVGAVERHAAPELSPATRDLVQADVRDWEGERMPLSRSWVDDAVEGLAENHRQTARLALLVAKAPYQVGDEVVRPVLESRGEAGLIRVLAWSAIIAVRHLTRIAADRTFRASDEMQAS